MRADLHGWARVRRAVEWVKRYRRALVLRAMYGAAYGASTTGASMLLIWLHSRF
ncbi:hypothetical protein [Streptomyces sp. NTH33]|uniref:hypothetical protein n=1 Tax=Streptomyces sp. NTH33 TaxID=1735453 RepID=UPI0015E8A4B0|nr:hypothetical protein [Streptomyces sp. NTH33]